jgi:chromosomal replication initiator protein
LSSLVTARHVAMYLAREIGQSHFATIGDYFGGRNHASVMYACQRVEKLKDSDLALSSDLDQLTAAMSR